MFIGRERELKILDNSFKSNQSEIVIIYGRRRIGKSSLVDKFIEKVPDCIKFEAFEGVSTVEQIAHFTESLKQQTNDPLLESVHFKTWENVFVFLTERVISDVSKRGKVVIFFDELQWMAAGREKLISILKYFWDNHWKKLNAMLILCGSIASFMVKKVIHSKALYGRISVEILLKALNPSDAAKLFKNKKSKEEILKYLMIFGCIPKYLEEIKMNQSFNKNINRLCFNENGIMVSEIKKIFYSQFKEAKTYLSIVSLLGNGIYTFAEISSKLKISTGGGLKQYLENLEQAEIINSFIPFNRGHRSKLKKYTLSDEYLIFYFKYIEPNLNSIYANISTRLFETISRDGFDIWMGFSFERFCIKNAAIIADKMGFRDEVLTASPYFGRNDRNFQIDLLYKRADNVITICEVKYHKKEISTKIIPEVERKCNLIDVPRGYTIDKALVSLYGPDKALRESEYFNYYITIDDIITT